MNSDNPSRPGRRSAVLYGVLLWLIPFLAGFAAFPLKQAGSPLFETILAVVLASTTAWLAARFVRRAGHCTWRLGARLGFLWMVICLVLDAGFFTWGPQALGLWPYLSDIGLTYLMIPAITAAVGWTAERGN
jgi:hypothetical protein